MGLLTLGIWVAQMLLHAVGPLPPTVLPYPALVWGFMPSLVLLNLVIPCSFDIPERSALLWREMEKKWIQSKQEVGGWARRREGGRLYSRCIVWEKNKEIEKAIHGTGCFNSLSLLLQNTRISLRETFRLWGRFSMTHANTLNPWDYPFFFTFDSAIVGKASKGHFISVWESHLNSPDSSSWWTVIFRMKSTISSSKKRAVWGWEDGSADKLIAA